MSEPIKLPPPRGGMGIIFSLSDMHAYARLAVEQATADLRKEFDSYENFSCQLVAALRKERDEARALVETQIIRLDNAHQALVNVRAQRDKAERERDEALIEAKQWENSALAIEVERDEARAELARLTTLRPASEHDGVAEVLWWGDGEFRYIGNEGDDWLCWTTLPDVKETK